MGSTKKKTYEFTPSDDVRPPPTRVEETPRDVRPPPTRGLDSTPVSPGVVVAGVALVILFLLLRDGATGAAATLAFPP